MLQTGKMLLMAPLSIALLEPASGKGGTEDPPPALQPPAQVDAEVRAILKKMRASLQFLEEAVAGLSTKERPPTLSPGTSGPDKRTRNRSSLS